MCRENVKAYGYCEQIRCALVYTFLIVHLTEYTTAALWIYSRYKLCLSGRMPYFSSFESSRTLYQIGHKRVSNIAETTNILCKTKIKRRDCLAINEISGIFQHQAFMLALPRLMQPTFGGPIEQLLSHLWLVGHYRTKPLPGLRATLSLPKLETHGNVPICPLVIQSDWALEPTSRFDCRAGHQKSAAIIDPQPASSARKFPIAQAVWQ